MNPWWRETIRLYCAMEDATPIVAACLEEEHPVASAIGLAIDCSKEAQKIDPLVHDKLDSLLQKGVEDADPERQHLIAEALLARRLRQMIHLNDETYLVTSFIRCAEYQVFLDEQRVRGRRHDQPDHWTSSRFVSGYGSEPVLGVRAWSAEAFCVWLTEREASGWRYRLPAPGELERESPVLKGLPSRTGFWLENRSGFIWVKDPLLIPETLGEQVEEQLRSLVNVQASADARDPLSSLSNEYHLKGRFFRISELTEALAYAGSLAYALADVEHLAVSSRNRTLALARILDIVHFCAGYSSSSPLILFWRQIRENTLYRTPLSFLEAYSSLLGGLPFSPLFKSFHLGIFDLARTLASACDRVRIRSYALPLVQDLDHIKVLSNRIIGAEYYDPTRDSYPKLVHDLANARPATINRILYRSLTHALALIHELVRSLGNDLSRALGTSPFHHAISLCNALIVSISLEQSLRHYLRMGRTGEDAYWYRLDAVLDIYLGAVILQKRIDGEFPACEGILIVKEKQSH